MSGAIVNDGSAHDGGCHLARCENGIQEVQAVGKIRERNYLLHSLKHQQFPNTAIFNPRNLSSLTLRNDQYQRNRQTCEEGSYAKEYRRSGHIEESQEDIYK